jgi:hypothetical protein
MTQELKIGDRVLVSMSDGDEQEAKLIDIKTYDHSPFQVSMGYPATWSSYGVELVRTGRLRWVYEKEIRQARSAEASAEAPSGTETPAWTIESEKEGLAVMAEAQIQAGVEQATRANRNRIDRLAEVGTHTVVIGDLPAVFQKATELELTLLLRVADETWFALTGVREGPGQTVWAYLDDMGDAWEPVENVIDPDGAPLAHIIVE